MSTSGTYNFAPTLGETVLYSYNNIGIRNTAILQQHMEFARMATNMMLARWSQQGVNLWAVDLVSTPLVQGQTSYTVDPSTIMVLDAYVTISSTSTDRIILPVSRSEYASYPQKTQQGFPTVFWFDRLESPNLYLWPTSDGTSAQTLNYYRVRQIQDANLAGGEQPEVPYRWLEAFSDGLTFRLAKGWGLKDAPHLNMPMLKTMADESYMIAADNDVENVPVFVSPMISGYWRN